MILCKLALIVSVAALALGATGAGSASASLLPTSTNMALTSTNATFTIGGFSLTCTGSLGFTTPAAGWPNGSVTAQNMGRTAPPDFYVCSPTCTVATVQTWTIAFKESPAAADLSNVDETTTSTVTMTMPAGQAITCGDCLISFGAGTLTGSYTDHSPSFSVSGSIPFTATGPGCGALGVPPSGSIAFSATYTFMSGNAPAYLTVT